MSISILIMLSIGQQVQITPPPPEQRRISLDTILNDDTPLILEFTTTFGAGTFDYEVTYDGLNGEIQTNRPIVFAQTGDGETNDPPEDDAISGVTYTVRMTAAQIAAWRQGSTEDQLIPNPGADNEIIAINAVRNREFNRSIFVRLFPSGNPQAPDIETASQEFQFAIDTIPPDPPEIVATQPGEQRVTIDFTASDSLRDDAQFFEAVFCTLRADTSTATIETELNTRDPITVTDFREFCDGAVDTERVGRTIDEVSVSGGLQNDVPVLLAMRSEDLLTNKGTLSEAVVETPRPTVDLFERFIENGGSEEGGFCFVATAAYGSYAHPVVRVLRGFRDVVLLPTPAGKLLVAAYYAHGPRWASWVAGDAGAKEGARFALVFVAFGALAMMLAPLLWLFFLLGRGARRYAAAFLAMGVLLAPNAARAELRPDSDFMLGFGFEFKAGALQLAEARNPDNAAFREVTDNVTQPQFMFGSELQIFRGFGTLGVYGSAGFARFTGRSLSAGNDGTGDASDRSSDSNTFNVVPLTGQLFYRMDFLATEFGFPIIPYVRGGLAYTFWWNRNALGEISRVEDGDREFVGQGGKFGYTGTVGVSLLLNWVDRAAAVDLHNTTGVRGTYIFAERTESVVDGFGQDGLDLSDGFFSFGLFMEL